MTHANQYVCSVVIPTKNGGELFRRVIRRLQDQSCWLRTQLIVVDSGSTDETVKVATEAGAVVQNIPASQFNHGATRDLAISLAASNNVILMVQDALPHDPHLLESLVAALAEPGIAGAYARQIPQPDADALTRRNLNNWLTGRLAREVRCIKDVQQYDKLSPLEKYHLCNFDNVCSAVNKLVWKEIKFGTINFGEDIDWSERVLRAGYTLVYEPKASVVHSHDRPLGYEYKRTYLCHRKLYQQFGLRLVPNLRLGLRSAVSASISDVRYVMQHEAGSLGKLKMILKIPALNLLSVYGQYQGARDEMTGIRRVIAGV